MRSVSFVLVLAACGAPRLPSDVAWTKRLDRGVFSYQMIAVDGDIALLTGPGEGAPAGLARLSAADGHVVWAVEYDVHSNFGTLVATGGELVVVHGDPNTNEVVLDRFGVDGGFVGTTTWTGLFDPADPMLVGCITTVHAAASTSDVVVAGCGGYQRGAPADPSPPVVRVTGFPYLVTASDDALALSTANGVTIIDASGSHSIGDLSPVGLALAQDGDVVVLERARVAAFARDTTQRWSTPLAFPPPASMVLAIASGGDVIVGGGVFFGADASDNAGDLVALDAATGVVRRDEAFYTEVTALAAPGRLVTLLTDPAPLVVALEGP